MNKRGIAVIVAAYVGMLTALVATVIGLGRLWPQPSADAGTLVPCAEEDGSGDGQAYPCVWDARTRGNGQYAGYPVTIYFHATCPVPEGTTAVCVDVDGWTAH